MIVWCTLNGNKSCHYCTLDHDTSPLGGHLTLCTDGHAHEESHHYVVANIKLMRRAMYHENPADKRIAKLPDVRICD